MSELFLSIIEICRWYKIEIYIIHHATYKHILNA